MRLVLKTWLGRVGLVTPVVALFTVAAIVLHTTLLSGSSFVFSEVGRSVFFTLQRRYGLVLVAVGVFAGLWLRWRQTPPPGAEPGLRGLWRFCREPRRLWGAVGGACLGLALAYVFNSNRSAADWVCAAALGSVLGGWQPVRSLRNRAALEVTFVLVGFVAISYAFTVIKACLFLDGQPDDAAIVAFINNYAGGTIYPAVAGWASQHPSWARVFDDFYFRIFDQMMAVSFFLAAAGRRADRITFQSSLAFCYLFGAVAYFIVPGLGPAFFDPQAYLFLKQQGLLSADVQAVLASNSLAVSRGALQDMPPYQFIACLPSLHMTHELVMLYYARYDRAFFAVKLVGALISAVAVVALGWHYGIDILAGAVLASVSVLIAEKARGRLFPAVLEDDDPQRELPHEPQADLHVDLAQARARAIAMIIGAGVLMFTAIVRTGMAMDVDVIGLGLAIDRFDVTQHQPQPPGYLGYVWFLRWLHAVSGLAAMSVVSLGAQLASVLTLWFLFRAARTLWPQKPGAALVAVGLAAASPLLLYYAVDGQTHAAEAAAGAGLLWAMTVYIVRPSARAAFAMGLCVAIGFAIRPTFVVFAAGPLLWLCLRRPAHWLPLVAPAALGAAVMTWLTMQLSGGADIYREATRALVLQTFMRTTSMLSSEADPRMVRENLVRIVWWTGLVLLPVVSMAVARGGRGLRSKPTTLLLTALASSLLFFVLTFCIEPGYLHPLTAFACLAAAGVWVHGEVGGRMRIALVAISSALFLIFVAGPGHGAGVYHWPTLGRVIERTLGGEEVAREVLKDIPTQDRILAVSDFSDQTYLRQLPLLRKNVAVLFVHDKRHVVFPTTTASFATARGWRGIPGPSLLSDGPPAELQVTDQFDWVVISPLASILLRSDLAGQASCRFPIKSTPSSSIQLRAAECFPEGRIRVGPHALRFGVHAELPSR